MKSLFQSYRFPVIVTVIMIVAVGFWAHQAWREIQLRERQMCIRFAQSSVESISAVLNSLWHRGRMDRRRATQVLEGMIKNSPIRFVALQHDDENVLQAGEIPPEFASLAPDQTLDDGNFLHRTTIHIGPEPSDHPQSTSRPVPDWPTSRPAPDWPTSMPASTSTPVTHSVFAGDYVLTLGIGSWRGGPGAPSPGGMSPPLRNLLLMFSLIILCIFAALVAWILAIRGKILAEQIKSQRAKLAHLEELGLVAAGLAHETKNPLGIISGIAQRITSSPGVTEQNRQSLEHILDEVDKASARLGDFIAFAKPPSAKISPLEADVLMTKIATILKPDFAAAGAELQTICPPMKILADEEMLRQIVVNLLLNSLNAMPSGGKATIRLERHINFATITVQDNGSGISPQLLPNIFKPYVTGKATGHGLGLAIVKRLVEEHKWTISAHSQPGSGTTMKISDILIAE